MTSRGFADIGALKSGRGGVAPETAAPANCHLAGLTNLDRGKK